MTLRRRSVFADRLLEFPDFTFLDGAEFARRGAWREFFARRVGPAFDGRVIFEIGCGDAALLTRVAIHHPTSAFVGIDWKCRALHTGAERIAAADVGNIALLHGRGQDIGRIFAEGELDEGWVFHPDPCDTPRELRNRLIAESFLVDLHRVLRSGGVLALKTDHPGYFQWVLGLFGVPEPKTFRPSVRARGLVSTDVPPPSRAAIDRFSVTAISTDFWNDDNVRSHTAARQFANESTAFERRFLKKRYPIYYIEAAPLCEMSNAE
jgi:tRNA G46 methylase TrmB